MKWFEILQEIKEAKGKTKQDVLEKYNDNEQLKNVLLFLNSPRIVTGISSKKWKKQYDNIITELDGIDIVDAVMEYLKVYNTGRDLDIMNVKAMVSGADSTEKEWLEKLITKDCPIGISASTINKVWPGLIPVFKLMKGKKYEGDEITEDFTISLKLDGNSATVFNLEEETYILSRSGAKMEGFQHIIDFYRENIPLGRVYCGEFIKKNYDNLEHGELFRVSNGIVNSKDKDKSSIQHIVFDNVPYDEYKPGKFKKPFGERKLYMELNLEKYHPYYNEAEREAGYDFLDVMHIPYYYIGKDNSEIEKWMSKMSELGLEGLMININKDKYKFGPQKSLLKVKDFYTMDLEVIGVKEHVRGNKVGAFIVDYKGFEVGVPSMKDELRNYYWKNQDEIIGKIIEIKYFRETEDKIGNKSLRFPSFIRVRDDKTLDDVSYD